MGSPVLLREDGALGLAMEPRKGGKCMGDNESSQEALGERRQYFRVDDILPVVVRVIHGDRSRVKAKVCTGFSAGAGAHLFHDETPDERIPPRLWEMLVDIQTKLSLMIDKLCQQGEGLVPSESKPVSISASGIRILTKDTFEIGQYVEVQMLLTLHAPVWIMVYGEVARFSSSDTGENEVAINFDDMDEDVRDMINYYTLKRQREVIRKQRGY